MSPLTLKRVMNAAARFVSAGVTYSCSHGRIQTGAQATRAPSKPMVGRSGLIRSVLLALPVKFQNAIKHA